MSASCSKIDSAEATRSYGLLSLFADAGTVDPLELALEGRAVPAFHARRAATGQRNSIDLAAVGLIIPKPGNACVQRQVGALKRVQALHFVVGYEVPMWEFLLSDCDAEATRE